MIIEIPEGYNMKLLFIIIRGKYTPYGVRKIEVILFIIVEGRHYEASFVRKILLLLSITG